MLKLDDLYDQLDPEELTEWRAMALLDGWGKDNSRAGIVAAAVHNSFVWANIPKPADREKAFRKPTDFIPKVGFKKKEKKQTQPADPISVTMGQMFGVDQT